MESLMLSPDLALGLGERALEIFINGMPWVQKISISGYAADCVHAVLVCVCGGGNWGGEVKQELTLAALGIKGRFGASVFWENNLLAQIVLSAGFISSLPKWRKECHSGHRL